MNNKNIIFKLLILVIGVFFCINVNADETYKVYWAVDGINCVQTNNCTMRISNNEINGTYQQGEVIQYSNGVIEGTPWDDLNYLGSITSLTIGGENDIIRPLSMKRWFAGLSQISEFNFDYLDTSRNTSLYQTFGWCTSLVNLDLSSFDTSNVTTMFQMFYGCTSLVNVNLSSFNTSNVTTIAGMFSVCMQIESLDLSSFDLSGLTQLYSPFSGTDNLLRIKTPKVMPNGTVPDDQIVFYDSDNNAYNIFTPSTPTKTWLNTFSPSTLQRGDIVNVMLKKLAGDEAYTYTFDNTSVKKILKSNTLPNDFVPTDDNTLSMKYDFSPVYAWFDNGTIYFYSEKQTVYLNSYSPYLFENFTKLETLDIVHINSSKAKHLQYIFSDCDSLETLDLSHFETNNAYDISGMFAWNVSLKSLDLSSFNTSNVTDMSYMFHDCESLRTLNISSFNTSSVMNVSNMFENCNSLTELDISNFDFNRASGQYTFRKMIMLKRLKTPRTMPTGNGLELPKTFYDSSNNAYTKLNSYTPTSTWLDVKQEAVLKDGVTINGIIKKIANTECPTCGADINTKNTNIKRIERSETLPEDFAPTIYNTISNDTSNYPVFVWFDNETIYYYCELDTIISNQPAYMFYNLRALESIDLSVFDFSNSSNFDYIFNYSKAITRIKTPKSMSTSEMSLSRKYEDSNGNIYNILNNETPTQTWIQTLSETTFVDGKTFNYSLKHSVHGGTSYNDYDGSIEQIVRSDTLTTDYEHMDYLSSSGGEIYGWYDVQAHTYYYYTSAETIYLNSDSSYMFNYLSHLRSINLSGFDTSKVTDMSYMFSKFNYLKNLNLSNFNTSNVTNMQSLFNGSNTLETIDLSGFDTSKVTDMSNMFDGCNKLNSLDLSLFNTSNVTSMSYMFNECSGLTSLNISSFDTSNVVNMNRMFYNCSSLVELDISSFNIQNEPGVSQMFNNTNKLNRIKTPYNISGNSVILFAKYFEDENGNQYNSITSSTEPNIWLTMEKSAIFDGGSNFRNKVLKVAYSTSTLKHFKRASELPENFTPNENNTLSISTSNYPIYAWLDLNTYTVYWYSQAEKIYLNANSSNLFYDFKYLEDIELSGIITSNVTDMSNMFYNCAALTNLDLSNFDTSKVTNMNSMFYNCSSLIELDLSNFVTSNVTDMSYMFTNCYKLISIDLSSFNTSKVTNMYRMFDSCQDLISLNLSNFNTVNVTNMDSMFRECRNLTFINISNFNTSNVTNMGHMFENCTKLLNINLSSFNTENVIDMSFMFENCSSLIALDLSSFDTSNVTNFDRMFEECRNLSTLNISSFDTSSATNLYKMFYDCAKITSLDLSGFTINNSMNYVDFFYNNRLLESLKTPKELTEIISLPLTFEDSQGNLYDEINSETPTSTLLLKASVAYILDGVSVKNILSGLYNNYVLNYTGAKSFKKFDTKGTDSFVISTERSNYPVYVWMEIDKTIGWYSEAETVFLNSNSSYMFSNIGFEMIDLRGLDFSLVNNVNKMFENNNTLLAIVVEDNFSLDDKLYSNTMFDGCSGLMGMNGTLYDVDNDSYAHIDGGTSNPGYFWDYAPAPFFYKIIGNDCGDQYGIGNCKLVISSDENFVNTSYGGETADIGIDHPNYSMYGRTYGNYFSANQTPWYYARKNIARVVVGGENNVIIPYNASYWFSGLNIIKSIDLTYFDTSKLVKVTNFLSNNSNLEVIKVSNSWNLNDGIIANDMFKDDTRLFGMNGTRYDADKNLEYARIDSENNPGYFWNEIPNKIYYALDGDECSNYSTNCTLTVSNNVIEGEHVVSGYTYTEIPRDDNYTIKNVQIGSEDNIIRLMSTRSLFNNYTSSSIDLSYLDTSNTYDMSGMFKNCYSFNKLDISDLDTTKVKYMDDMFKNDVNLRVIVVSDKWDTSNLVSSEDMFLNDSLIYGMYGTSYNSNDIGVTMARIDSENTPGYFWSYIPEKINWAVDGTFCSDSNGECTLTLSTKPIDGTHYDSGSFDIFDYYYSVPWSNYSPNIVSVIIGGENDIIRPINLSNMFSNMYKLRSIDLTYLDTTLANNMHGMFHGCNKLMNIDVSHFVTKNVTDMSYMFSNCSNLMILDLSNFDTSKVQDMSYMFSWDSNLQQVKVSDKWNTDNVTTSNGMFDSCTMIFGQNGTHYGTVSNDKQYARLDLEGTPGYFWDHFDITKLKIVVPNTLTILSGKAAVVNLAWDKNNSALGYNIYRSEKSNTGYRKIASTTETEFTDTSVVIGKSYYYIIRAYNDVGEGVNSNTVGKAIRPNKIEGLKAKGVNQSKIIITWNREAVSGYLVQMGSSKTNFTTVSTITKYTTNTYTKAKLKPNSLRFFRVRAFKVVNGKRVYGEWSDIFCTRTAPVNPKISGIGNLTYNSLKLNYKKNAGTVSYVLYRSTNSKSGYVFVNKTSDLSFIDENVITGKTYYYKLRACNAYGYCSGYSKVVSRKVIPVTPAFAISSTETKKINIKLATRDIVTGYQIFASTRKNGTYVKIAQLYDPEDLNFTYNSKKGTTYYFKVRSYININGKYYYSNFSGIKYIKSK